MARSVSAGLGTAWSHVAGRRTAWSHVAGTRPTAWSHVAGTRAAATTPRAATAATAAAAAAAVRVVTPTRLELAWKEAVPATQHHALWLQDHDPAFVDPDSGQKLRTVTASVQPARQIAAAALEDSGHAVRITWSDRTQTVFRTAWIFEYATHAGRERAPWINGAAARPAPWTAPELHRARPEVDGRAVLTDDRALWDLLRHLHDYGICFVRAVPTEDVDASARIAERIGPIHETFYGRLWDVRSIPHAHNIAYTSGDLALHQDLEYFEAPPGLQLLHCLKSSAAGGSSTFADGFKAAELLLKHHPQHYMTLRSVPVTFHYRQGDHHLRFRRRTIEEDGLNEYMRINYAPPFQGPLEASLDQIEPFYDAITAFANLVNHIDLVYETRMTPGDLVVFNNRRVLHGRTKFDPTTGERHLRGSYIDLDAFRDRWRVLAHRFHGGGV